MLAAVPGIGSFGSRFLAGGAPGYGEAAPGDHLQTAYHLWLFGSQIEHGRYPWRDPYQFRPEAKPTVNPAVWPFGPVYWPLWRIFDPVVAWNLFVLLTFVLAGLLACAWLRELGLPRGPALAGGLAFEIAPYRTVQSAGHLLGPVAVLLPLSLYALERGRKGSPLWYLLAAAAIASIPLSGQAHLAIGAIPFFLAYGAVRLPETVRRRAFHLTGTATGVGLAVAAGILIDRALVRGSINAQGRSLASVGAYSAEWVDFLVRHDRHGSESFVFLGWATPIAALFGLAVLCRSRRWLLAVVLGLGVAIPMLLALGTNTPLYRPVRAVVPGLQYPRVPERIMPVACLAIAALAAFGVSALAEADVAGYARWTWTTAGLVRREARAVLVGAIALVAVAADLHVHALRATAADQGNRAYAALQGGPRDARLLELPVFLPDVHYGSVYQYYDTGARRERPSGYSTTAPVSADATARRLLALNCGDWTTRPGAVLRQLGVREIVFHRGLFVLNPAVPKRTWFAWLGLVQHGYRPWASDGAVTVLDRLHGGVPPPPAPVPEPHRDAIHLCQNWYRNDGDGRAMSASHAAFWVYGARIRLIMRSLAPLDVRFGVDGRPLFTRRVEPPQEYPLSLGRTGWHLVTLDTPALPVVAGRREGARLLAYVLG